MASLKKNSKDVKSRELEAVRLALAKVPYEQIAEQTGFADASGAYRSVMRVLQRNTNELADELRTQELAVLDRLQTAITDKALAGDLNALSKVLDIMARRAKYVAGLESPQRIDVQRSEDESLSEAMAVIEKLKQQKETT